MTKTINMTYEDFIKTSRTGLKKTITGLGPLGYLVQGKQFDRMFSNLEKDVQNKMRTNQVQFVGSSNRPRGRTNLRVKRRSLMKAKRI
tara:strand:+ start:645 stop:908 length:264 start_codon:yes stop_codon:yes gene_type:complete